VILGTVLQRLVLVQVHVETLDYQDFQDDQDLQESTDSQVIEFLILADIFVRENMV